MRGSRRRCANAGDSRRRRESSRRLPPSTGRRSFVTTGPRRAQSADVQQRGHQVRPQKSGEGTGHSSSSRECGSGEPGQSSFSRETDAKEPNQSSFSRESGSGEPGDSSPSRGSVRENGPHMFLAKGTRRNGRMQFLERNWRDRIEPEDVFGRTRTRRFSAPRRAGAARPNALAAGSTEAPLRALRASVVKPLSRPAISGSRAWSSRLRASPALRRRRRRAWLRPCRGP